MATLTSQTTFTIGDAATEQASAQITILPALGESIGSGRLIHPTLGIYDYEQCPDEWSNLDGDVIIAPIWASTKTLQGSANTLFQGHLRDTVIEERWLGDLSMRMEMLRVLLAFWQNPPNPATDYVQWYPNYTSSLGYQVILLAVNVAGEGVHLDYVSRQGWVNGEVSLRLKVAGRL